MKTIINTTKVNKNGQFSNLIELMSHFSDQHTCKEYLESIRWNGSRDCPHCGHYKSYKLKSYFTYKCAECKRIFSITKGTIFENSPIPLQKWFAAMYLVSSHKKGISSIQLSKDLGITQKSAWFMLQRIRFAIRTKSYNTPLNGIVEIDESYLGGKNRNRHSHKKVENSQGRSTKDKAAVLGMVERGGELRAFKIENASSSEVLPHVFNNVAEDTQIMTDEWLGYKPLERHYPHSVVRHSQFQYVIGNCHTNTIEGFWSLLKRGILGIYHWTSKKHLNKYIDEFTFRYNTRDLTEADRFTFTLAFGSDSRLTYKTLTK